MTIERPVNVERRLYGRVNRKLRRYGHTVDGAVAAILSAMLSTRGDPLANLDLEFANADDAIAYLHAHVPGRT